jgi:hypothetical protein
MKNKLIIGIVIMLSFSMILISCNKKSENTNVETPYYTLDIDGDPTYFSEDDIKVINAKKISKEFCRAKFNRDYNNLDSQAEYKYYINNLYEKYIENKKYEQTEKYYKEYKLIERCDSIEIKNIKFYTKQGVEACKVNLIYKDTLINAVEDYLEYYEYKLNVPYKSENSIYMKIEDDVWKVYDWKSGDREEI